MPFNDVAQTIVESLVNKFNYSTTGPKAEKYAVMIASIIKAAKKHYQSNQRVENLSI